MSPRRNLTSKINLAHATYLTWLKAHARSWIYSNWASLSRNSKRVGSRSLGQSCVEGNSRWCEKTSRSFHLHFMPTIRFSTLCRSTFSKRKCGWKPPFPFNVVFLFLFSPTIYNIVVEFDCSGSLESLFESVHIPLVDVWQWKSFLVTLYWL